MKPLLQNWHDIAEKLRVQSASSAACLAAWSACFSKWDATIHGPPPIWIPPTTIRTHSNLGRWIAERNLNSVTQFHRWSVEHRAEFWQSAVDRLGIFFQQPATKVLDESRDSHEVAWFADARLNIVEPCFQAPEEAVAMVSQSPGAPVRKMTYGELRRLTNRVSNSLVDIGLKLGDAVALALPVTAASVPIYLGIIQSGCVVVAMADQTPTQEMATRLKNFNVKLVFTYDHSIEDGKKHPLFRRIADASETPTVVLNTGDVIDVDLRDQDRDWDEFLVDRDQFRPVDAAPHETISILFSPDCPGENTSIPWNHLTPIKCAVDGYCHQDIRPGQVCCWPARWDSMTTPWLIFASLINRATLGIYEGNPTGNGFGSFVTAAKVGVLGVTPALVSDWRASEQMEPWDWSAIDVFTSTGETSQASDMAYLSSLACLKPIIEYCGGPEIGGGYISSTVLTANVPSAFNTPAMGLNWVLVDEAGKASERGEIFLIPPAIGLSTRMINGDHHEAYYANVPHVEGVKQLRRQGGHFRRLANGHYVAEQTSQNKTLQNKTLRKKT